MNHLKLLSISVLCFALGSAVHAQTTDGSVLYTANVDLTTLSQNSFVGTVGGIFLTSYSYYPELNYLGYADPTGAPLQDSHLVTLWDNSTGGIIASATVPAGNAAPLIDGYRWVQLSSTVTLNYGSYYVIGAQTDGVDLWGDLISNNSPDSGSNGQINWNAEYVQLGSGWEFTRAGRYDSGSDYPSEPPNQTSLQDSIYPAANMGYDLEPVPEPGILAIAGIGAALLFGFARLKKTAYEPDNILLRKILPHPCPLPLGEGELSADDLSGRKQLSFLVPIPAEKHRKRTLPICSSGMI